MRYLVIRTENLGKEYRRQPALSNLTIEVEPGEVYGVLGPQGSGKSTLAHILMDLVRPTHGNALVMGLDCQRQSMQVRRLVGYLPQRLSFPGRGNGIQWISRVAAARGGLDWEQTHQLANRFGVDLYKSTHQMSPGEQRKLGIIQAVLHQPELLILDEPFNGLDAKAQGELYRLVSELRNEGRTVLIPSKSLNEMERICDRVAVLNRGQLVAVERGVQLRGRAMRKIEMRFATPVCADSFAGLSNLNNLVCDSNRLYCTVQGDPDALIKAAAQYRILDFISQQPSLEEVYQTYYGIAAYAG